METVSRESCCSSFPDCIFHALPSITFNLKRQRRETKESKVAFLEKSCPGKEINPPSRFNLNEVLYEKKVAPLSDDPPLPPPTLPPPGKWVGPGVTPDYLSSCPILQKLPQETFIQILKSTFHGILVNESITE